MIEIQKLLKGMDLPSLRVEKLTSENTGERLWSLSWLVRNMGFKNKKHPNFPKAKIEVARALKRLRDEQIQGR